MNLFNPLQAFAIFQHPQHPVARNSMRQSVSLMIVLLLCFYNAWKLTALLYFPAHYLNTGNHSDIAQSTKLGSWLIQIEINGTRIIYEIVWCYCCAKAVLSLRSIFSICPHNLPTEVPIRLALWGPCRYSQEEIIESSTVESADLLSGLCLAWWSNLSCLTLQCFQMANIQDIRWHKVFLKKTPELFTLRTYDLCRKSAFWVLDSRKKNMWIPVLGALQATVLLVSLRSYR